MGRALIRDPQVFLFDEPLSNLDAELRVSMRSEIIALHRRLATTMIYVTHDQVEAMTMADRIVVLRAGRVEQAGAPLDLYNAPANRFVAGFIGSPQMNFLPAKAIAIGAGEVTVELPGGLRVAVPASGDGIAPGTALTLGVRPEHLVAGSHAGAPMAVVVEQVEQLGGSSLIHGKLASDGTRIAIGVAGQTRSAVGETIGTSFAPAFAHLFRDDGAVLPRA